MYISDVNTRKTKGKRHRVQFKFGSKYILHLKKNALPVFLQFGTRPKTMCKSTHVYFTFRTQRGEIGFKFGSLLLMHQQPNPTVKLLSITKNLEYYFNMITYIFILQNALKC